MYSLEEFALSAGVLVALVTVLSACVCGCKNSNQKSELVGTAGVVKIHFEEDVPSPTPTTPASIKRASTQNSQRSLPEIPQPVGRHDSGDTASDTYATVNLDDALKVIPAASTSREPPYEHTYAKPIKENHIVVEITPDQRPHEDLQIDERDSSQLGPECVVISASVAISGQLPSSQELPYITPPARAADPPPQHFSGDSTDSTKGYTSISVRQPLSNIRATTLPNKPLSQPHYATVSDDSDDMYAAIDAASAGGSETYAQIAPHHARHDLLPGDARARRSAPPEMGSSSSNAVHSRQASSSSCSMSVGAPSSPKPEKRQANSPLPPTPHASRPAPHAAPHAATAPHAAPHVAPHAAPHVAPHAAPHVAPHVVPHAAPHPAPHPANHKQRIASTGDLHFSHDKLRRSLNEKHQRNNSCVSSSDFYGCNYPVDKHRFSSGDLIRPLVAKELKFDIDQKEDVADNLYNSIDGPGCSDYSSADANTSINSEHRVNESPSKNVEEMYAKVIKKAKHKEEPSRRSKDISDGVEGESRPAKCRGDDPGYETIDRRKSVNHGYETIQAHKERQNPHRQDPGYETVKDLHITGPNASLTNNNLLSKLNHLALDSGPNSILSSDPGYEHISKTDNSASDSDPNYEVLRNQPPTPPYATIAPNYKMQPTYSMVNKRPGKSNDWSTNNNEEAAPEPNYESMPNDLFYTTGSESDPNYESVRPKDYESMNPQDPNYESIRRKDPKYESVRSRDSNRSKDPNYESVKYMELSRKDPPYERLHNVGGEAVAVERSDSAAGYEKINVPKSRDSKNSINSGESGTVSDYFQV